MIGAILGGAGGLVSSLFGSNRQKDAVNRARLINRYSTLNGRVAKEPEAPKGFWGNLLDAGKGAVAGYKLEKDLMGTDKDKKSEDTGGALQKKANQTTNIARHQQPVHITTPRALPKHGMFVPLKARKGYYTNSPYATQEALWSKNWGPIEENRPKMKGLIY